MKSQYLFLFVFLVFALLNTNHAQEMGQPINIGYETSIESKVLGETRPLLIHLPNGYENSEKPYPVIYLLDGSGHFHHTTGTMRFLARSNRMPEMIIIGIPNTDDRTRDLTPPLKGDNAQFPTAGGADNMLKFIESELIPFVNQHYRTNAYKLLIGHSFGGLFAVHAMVNHPGLFDAHLAISPSMWWDNQTLVEQAEQFLDENPEHETRLYMTMGNEGGTMLGGAWKLAAALEEKAKSDKFFWEFHVMNSEDHGSVVHRSTYNGLEALFKDWRLEDVFELYQQGGIKAIQAHYENVKEVYDIEGKPSENMMNSLGYRLLGSGQVDAAIEVFTQNVQDYPKSFNVYDSLGEGYKVKGEKEKAIKNYKRSMELNPGNSNGIKMLAELGVDYTPEEAKVKVKVLKSYVGVYEVEPGMDVTFTLEEGKLYGQPNDGDKRVLIPLTENKFYLNDENIQAEFHRNEKKEVDRVTIYMGNQVMEAKRKED